MTDPHSCPLCTERYDDRTDLRVHLEVEHRKSEVVSYLIELETEDTEVPIDREGPTVGEERPATSA
ncbi:hypothetical protein [Natrinema ejinorense]|uniref:C2H2-type domain-containing protein n=1 Tax=Natrinema ejinorense TaxID=373386 RepID=A0A2A5R0L4_9EURY|nr:hypothetical protein [Natrinema ejinorense]PCR92621.1 hypothetical protein CP557_05690 [Natrinema ejinorense]